MQKLERRIAKEKQRRALIKQQTDESVTHIEQKIKVTRCEFGGPMVLMYM
jgi:hypothetical protein